MFKEKKKFFDCKSKEYSLGKTVLSMDYNVSYSKSGLSLMITDMREQ